MSDDGIPVLFPRDLDLGAPAIPYKGNLVQVVTGVRRCGKTYRLYQEMARLESMDVSRASMLYFNFEDERLKPYEPQLLNAVVETFYAMNPSAREEGAYFFLDEIQEVPEWGTFLRRMVDTQKVTIYVTSSSSKMLSSSLASKFRGRALSRELFPMSFSEFARFNGVGLSTRIDGADCLALGEKDKDALRFLLPSSALRAAMARYQIEEGHIVTFDESSELSCEKGAIHVVPAWKWLL